MSMIVQVYDTIMSMIIIYLWLYYAYVTTYWNWRSGCRECFNNLKYRKLRNQAIKLYWGGGHEDEKSKV